MKLCWWSLFHDVRFAVQGLKLYPIDLLCSTGLSIEFNYGENTCSKDVLAFGFSSFIYKWLVNNGTWFLKVYNMQQAKVRGLVIIAFYTTILKSTNRRKFRSILVQIVSILKLGTKLWKSGDLIRLKIG